MQRKIKQGSQPPVHLQHIVLCCLVLVKSHTKELVNSPSIETVHIVCAMEALQSDQESNPLFVQG